MSKTITAVIVALTFIASPAKAQVGFATGLIIGSAMSGPDDSKSGGGAASADIIYRGTFGDRKFNWWEVYSGVTCKYDNDTLWNMATQLMQNPNDFDILEIRRLPGLLSQKQCFAFTYSRKPR